MSNLANSIWANHSDLTDRLVYLYRVRPMLSHREIAMELSREFNLPIGRNHVIGKVNRLKLEVREVVSIAPPSHEAPPTRDVPRVPSRPAVLQGSVDFLDLPSWGCKFPYGESPVRFCGRTRWGERPYCPQHCRMAYNLPLERRA